MSIVDYIEKYKRLGIDQTIDKELFNHIAVVHHSTVLEGSTLTDVETAVLITEDLTPKGKPLSYSLMVKDHYDALVFALEEAKRKSPVSVGFVRELNARVLKSTGSVYETVFGQVDASKGELRKGNVSAGTTYFPNFSKVPSLLENLIRDIGTRMSGQLTLEDKINLSFDAHFSFVSIHPFYDGNGRTSRLLMNYIQAYYDLPLAIVNEKSKADYIQALLDTRANQDITIFRNFMYMEYGGMLKKEIAEFEKMQDHNRSTEWGMGL